MSGWTAVWWQWARGLELAYPEQNTTLVELVLEVDHQAQRIDRLDGAIDRAVTEAPEQLRALVDALQALRGVAKVTAVTLATEFGSFSRFERAVQVMSYTGMVPSEHSSGPRCRRGAITKTGNSHLRRVLVEAAWHYRHRPKLNQRQKELQPSQADRQDRHRRGSRARRIRLGHRHRNRKQLNRQSRLNEPTQMK
jgi:transposase